MFHVKHKLIFGMRKTTSKKCSRLALEIPPPDSIPTSSFTKNSPPKNSAMFHVKHKLIFLSRMDILKKDFSYLYI